METEQQVNNALIHSRLQAVLEDARKLRPQDDSRLDEYWSWFLAGISNQIAYFEKWIESQE